MTIITKINNYIPISFLIGLQENQEAMSASHLKKGEMGI